MANAHGGARAGAGRKSKAERFAPKIERAENLVARRLNDYIENLQALADGGYERVKEKYLPAGLILVDSLEDILDADGEPTGKTARRKILAYPTLPPDQMVLVERIVEIADRDRDSNKYLADRILGKPSQAVELSGPDGGPMEMSAPVLDEAAEKLRVWREQMRSEIQNMPLAPPTPPILPTDTES